MKASYTPEKAWAEMQGDLPCYLVYRPLSFYLTPLFLRLGVPVTGVTLLSLGIALTMTFFAWRGGAGAYWVVAGLGFLYHVMDCVDGNMARTTGRTTKLGGILDGTIDMSFWCMLLFSLGLLVDHDGGGVLGPHAIAFSLGIAVVLLLNRQTRDSFAAQSAEATYFRDEIPERIGWTDRLLMAVVGLEFVYVFAIAIGGLLGVLDRVLVGIGVYVALISAGALYMTFAKAAAMDRSTSSSDPR